jgi:para-aminobenzoate synthetase component I
VVFDRLYAASENAFWLDRGASATRGVSHMGEAAAGASIVTADAQGGTVTRHGGAHARAEIADPPRRETIFDFLDRELSDAACVEAPIATADDEAFVPAWIGWLGYEAGAQHAGAPVATSRYPDAALLFAQRAVSFDHATGSITLTTPNDEAGRAWLATTRASVRACIGTAAPALRAVSRSARGLWRHADDDYLRMIADAQAAITRGDAYQLCLTNELRAPVIVDPFQSYRALRRASPTANGGYLRFGPVALLSASPEQFLQISGDGLVVTRPIKGTRPRGTNQRDDARLRDQLRSNEKERAENLMIVDLMRNDLGRIARLGSVEVSDLLRVESYAQVHQLVSTVRARLAHGMSSVDAVRACFPAGSMTGAPKLSAMRVLHELEAGARGVYSGCFGSFSLDGRVRLSMVIRSIVVDGSGVSIGSGGGITALSIPEEELAEVRLKAHILAESVGVDLNVG